MRLAAITGGIIAVMLGCSVLAQRNAEKPPGTHYSAAFLTGGGLVVFPFDRKEVTLDLPSGFSGQIFSADGKKVYGFARSADAEAPPIAVASITPPGLTAVEASRGLTDVQSIVADAEGGIMAVTGIYRHYGVQECGVFELDISKDTAEHIVNNPGGERFDFVSLWNQLSLSPDGSRLVGRAGKGELGLVNVREHRVEKRWRGAAA